MPRHPTVPDELAHGPFRGSWAVGAGLLTKYQLRSRAWVRVFRDVYLARPLGDDDGMRLAALQVATPPGTIVSGLTAAWLHRAWSPPPGQVVPLEITRPVRAPGTPIAGLHRRRLVLRGTPDLVRPEVGLSELDRDVVLCGDVRATSPVRTCFDLSATTISWRRSPSPMRSSTGPGCRSRSWTPTARTVGGGRTSASPGPP